MKNLLFGKRSGQVSIDQLQGYAIAFVVIGVVLTVGLSILGGVQEAMVLTESVYDESHSPSTPFPSNVTVDKASDAEFLQLEEDTEELVFYDSSAGSNTTLTSGSDYVSFYEDGVFELQNTTATEDYNDSEDSIYVDYTAEMEDTEARNGASSAMDGLTTFTEWLPVVALVVVAAIVVGLVSMFRSGSNGRRGRA